MIAIWLAALIGCDGVSRVPCDATLDPDVTLVAHVTWETPDVGGISSVGYSVDGEQRGTPDISGDGAVHDVALYGLPPLTDVAFVARTATATESWTCEGTVRTGNLPPGLPAFDVTVDDPARSSPRYLVGTLVLPNSPVFILDRATGEWVWYRQAIRDDLSVEAKLDDQGVLAVNAFPLDGHLDGSTLSWSKLDGDVVREVITPEAHHVFSPRDDGIVGMMANDIRSIYVDAFGQDEPVVGDVVQELQPDGTTTELWNTWDHVAIPDDLALLPDFYPNALDWTHGNALSMVPGRDAWLFSMAYARTLVEIDRSTRETVQSYHADDPWMLDGDGLPVKSGLKFYFQHDAHFLDDGDLLMFATDPVDSSTGAVEYRVDPDGLAEVWRYGFSDQRVKSASLGQATRLDNGDTLINFAAAGLIREVAPDGTVVWELKAPLMTWFGQVYLVDDLHG